MDICFINAVDGCIARLDFRKGTIAPLLLMATIVVKQIVYLFVANMPRCCMMLLGVSSIHRFNPPFCRSFSYRWKPWPLWLFHSWRVGRLRLWKRLFVSPKRLGFLDLSGSFWQVASMVCPLNLDHHTLKHPGFVWRSCGTCPLKRSEWAPRTTTEPRPFSSCFRWYSRKRLWWRWWTSDIPISNRNMIRSDKSWDFDVPYFQTKPSENQQTGLTRWPQVSKPTLSNQQPLADVFSKSGSKRSWNIGILHIVIS